jgi:hypothetical protein
MILGLSMVRLPLPNLHQECLTDTLELDVRFICSRLGLTNGRNPIFFSFHFPRHIHSELMYRYCLTCTVLMGSGDLQAFCMVMIIPTKVSDQCIYVIYPLYPNLQICVYRYVE